MMSTHPVNAQNLSNTLLAIKHRKTNKHWSLAYHSVSHRSHKPHPPSGGTCFMVQCMFIWSRQACPTPPTLCYVFTTPIPHFKTATIPIYSICTCPYSIQMSILCALTQENYSLCQIWTMDAPFCAQLYYRCILRIQKSFILIVVALHFSSNTFIHQSPWHNWVTILGHSKYDILVHHARIPKTIHAHFNAMLPHLYRLSAILINVHHFTLQPSMNCYIVYICHQLYLKCRFNVGTFLHQQLDNFNMAIPCC